ncbi:MAG: gamma-glutamylcyclotransferase family protein [Chloroflexota bacterium]
MKPVTQILFVYGSLMHSDQMKKTCGDADSPGYGRVDGYRIAFNRLSRVWGGGVADLVPAEGMTVYGRVYSVEDACKVAMDIREQNGIVYIRVPITVTLPAEERTVEASTYKIIQPETYEIAPAEGYIYAITQGAREANLPQAYREFLYGLWRERQHVPFRRGLMRTLRPIHDGIAVNPADAPPDRPSTVTVRFSRYRTRAALSVSRDQPKGTCSAGPDVLQALHLPAHESYGANLHIEP